MVATSSERVVLRSVESRLHARKCKQAQQVTTTMHSEAIRETTLTARARLLSNNVDDNVRSDVIDDVMGCIRPKKVSSVFFV